jgi:hypothetical protein
VQQLQVSSLFRGLIGTMAPVSVTIDRIPPRLTLQAPTYTADTTPRVFVSVDAFHLAELAGP